MAKNKNLSTRKQKFDPFSKKKKNVKSMFNPASSRIGKNVKSLDEKVIIKRVNINHKYFIVAKQKDRILDKIKWSRKTKILDFSTGKQKIKDVRSMNIKKARAFYKEKRSFNPLIDKFKMTNMTEVTDFSKSPRKPRNSRPGQYVVEGQFKDGSLITARSMKIGEVEAGTHKEAKESAWNNFWRLVSQKFGGDYTVSSGKIYDKELKSVREGMVFYVGNPKTSQV